MLHVPKLSLNDASRHSFSGEFPPSSFGLGFHGSASKKPKPSGRCIATLCQESVAFCPISSAAVIGALHELPRVSRNLHFATFVRHYVPPVVSVRLDFRRRPHCAFSPPDDFVWLSYVAEFEQLPHSSALPSLYRYRRLSGRWAFSHEFHFPLQALPSLLEQPLRTKCVS